MENGEPKFIGLLKDCVVGDWADNSGFWDSTWSFEFGLLMTFEVEGWGAFGERVNNCCQDFLGAVPGCGSEWTCNEYLKM